jgi:hypothetical protein
LESLPFESSVSLSESALSELLVSSLSLLESSLSELLVSSLSLPESSLSELLVSSLSLPEPLLLESLLESFPPSLAGRVIVDFPVSMSWLTVVPSEYVIEPSEFTVPRFPLGSDPRTLVPSGY